MMCGTVCALTLHIVIHICFEFGQKEHVFCNYEEFDECIYGTCGVQYLQRGKNTFTTTLQLVLTLFEPSYQR